MRFMLSAGMRALGDCIRVLEQHCWYDGHCCASLVLLVALSLLYFLFYFLFSVFIILWYTVGLQGVGPNIAISYAAYETLRSHWQLER